MIFTAPAIVTVVGWAITSYVITGVFFAESASIYSNTAAIKDNLFLNFHGRVLYELHCIEALGLFLPLLLVVSLVVAIAPRDARLLAPMALLGGASGLPDPIPQGDITANFRDFILVLPVDIFLVGSLVAAIQAPRPTLARAANSLRVSPTRGRTLPAVAAVMLIVAIMVPTAVTTGTALLNPNVGTYESAEIGWIFHAHPSEWDIENKNNTIGSCPLETGLQVATFQTGMSSLTWQVVCPTSSQPSPSRRSLSSRTIGTFSGSSLIRFHFIPTTSLKLTQPDPRVPTQALSTQLCGGPEQASRRWSMNSRSVRLVPGSAYSGVTGQSNTVT